MIALAVTLGALGLLVGALEILTSGWGIEHPLDRAIARERARLKARRERSVARRG